MGIGVTPPAPRPSGPASSATSAAVSVFPYTRKSSSAPFRYGSAYWDLPRYPARMWLPNMSGCAVTCSLRPFSAPSTYSTAVPFPYVSATCTQVSVGSWSTSMRSSAPAPPAVIAKRRVSAPERGVRNRLAEAPLPMSKTRVHVSGVPSSFTQVATEYAVAPASTSSANFT